MYSVFRDKLTRANLMTKTCAVALLLLILLSLFAPFIAPFQPSSQKLIYRLRPPVGMERSIPGHWLGTDELGRDIFSRSLYALRISIGLAFLGSVLGALLGSLLGLLAGLGEKYMDTIVMGLVDAQIAIPFTLIAVFVIAVAGTGMGILVLVLGVAYWERYARLIRGQAMVLKESYYVEASRSMGAGTFRVAVRHVLPNVFPSIIVMFSLNFRNIILLESTLSFLGLGIQPPAVSLGLMIAQGRDYMANAWWLVAVPSCLIVIMSLVVLVLGDWLREALDAKLY